MKMRPEKTNKSTDSIGWLNMVIIASFVFLALLLIKKLMYSPMSSDSGPEVVRTQEVQSAASIPTHARDSGKRRERQKAQALENRAFLKSQIQRGLDENEFTLQVRPDQLIAVQTDHGQMVFGIREAQVGPCQKQEAWPGENRELDENEVRQDCLYVDGGRLRLNEEMKRKLPPRLFYRDQSYK